jgi:hypothetical protein
MDNKKLAESKDPINVARPPDFANRMFGIAIWVNEDKNHRKYLSVHIPLLGLKGINCFSVNAQGQEEE